MVQCDFVGDEGPGGSVPWEGAGKGAGKGAGGECKGKGWKRECKGECKGEVQARRCKREGKASCRPQTPAIRSIKLYFCLKSIIF